MTPNWVSTFPGQDHNQTFTMLNTRLLSLAFATTLSGITAAQGCVYNEFPITLVDAAGVPLPVGTAATGETMPLSPTEVVYLAFDPGTPTGTYYVHVTDPNITEVVSANDPTDRFVDVVNNNGTITLSQPGGTGTSAFGVGLNGLGQSLLVTPVSAPTLGGCVFKLWFSDIWLLNSNGTEWPHITRPFDDQTGACANISYKNFQIGDGTPGDVKGSVFEDVNGNGQRDAGEPGLAGWEVRLVDSTTAITTTTDALGNYCFVDIGAGNFTTELTLQGGYSATTSIANIVEATACADSDGSSFGVNMAVSQDCEARTIGYWRNKHGRNIVQQLNILPLLQALCIVDASGSTVVFGSVNEYKSWLKGAHAVNMAYMLSAQLVAMHNNVLAGYVDGKCVVNDPQLGVVSISTLMAEAVASLCLHPSTPSGSAERAPQEALKNALDRANNNQNWQ
jgi:hypothetical protein